MICVIQGDHQSCSSESPCQQPGYVPQRKPLTMPAAISAYEAALRKPSSTKTLRSATKAAGRHPVVHSTCIDECVGMWLITGTIEPQMSRNVADSGLCIVYICTYTGLFTNCIALYYLCYLFD